jgi:hypothetical protein
MRGLTGSADRRSPNLFEPLLREAPDQGMLIIFKLLDKTPLPSFNSKH